MQTRDGVTDNIAPQFTDPGSLAETVRPYPIAIRALALIASWLVPGAGHLVLGRFGRGIMFLVVIGGAFIFGLALDGRLYWPMVADPPSAFHFDLITVLWSLAQVGAGLCYVVSYALGIGTTPEYSSATYDYGNTFTFLAGLLNYLVIYDAFDIAAGRKR